VKRKKELKPAKGKGSGQSFRDYDPRKVDPKSEQFAPTEESPIRRSARAAGVS
jgi:hypothetical protein